MGPRGIFTVEFAKYSGAFLFFWTFFALGVTGMFSFILSVQGLWRLRRPDRGRIRTMREAMDLPGLDHPQVHEIP